MHDADGDDLDKDVEESNGSDEESDLDDPEEQTDQTTTETEEPVPAVRESLITDSRDLKLVEELLQKTDDVKRRCTSNSLIICLAKIEGQLKTEARCSRKKDKKADGILKEAILNNEDDSEGHDETKRFRKA